MWSTLGYVALIAINSYFLRKGILSLKHNTRGIELFDEGIRILQEEGHMLTAEQRADMIRRVSGLLPHRRWAFWDTIMIIVNMVCVMSAGYMLWQSVRCM